MTQHLDIRSVVTKRVPRLLTTSADLVLSARGRPGRLRSVVDRSAVPMVVVDDQRRYVHANVPARLAVRRGMPELRRLRIDDLTPPHFQPALELAWARLLSLGRVGGLYEVASPADTRMDVEYYATAEALPKLYLITFAPIGWAEEELQESVPAPARAPAPVLTPRELEVLQLAADGLDAPQIASELVLSVATVRTHFANVYEKLEVSDRAGAVAKAMRLGLIS